MVRYPSGQREGVLDDILELTKKVVKLNEEIVLLQKENDKLQKQMLWATIVIPFVALMISFIVRFS